MCRVEYFKQFFAIDIVNAACVSSSAVVVELVIGSQIAVSLSAWNITRIFSIGLQCAAIWSVRPRPCLCSVFVAVMIAFWIVACGIIIHVCSNTN